MQQTYDTYECIINSYKKEIDELKAVIEHQKLVIKQKDDLIEKLRCNIADISDYAEIDVDENGEVIL